MNNSHETDPLLPAACEIAECLVELGNRSRFSDLEIAALALQYARLEAQGHVIDLERGQVAAVSPDDPIDFVVNTLLILYLDQGKSL